MGIETETPTPIIITNVTNTFFIITRFFIQSLFTNRHSTKCMPEFVIYYKAFIIQAPKLQPPHKIIPQSCKQKLK